MHVFWTWSESICSDHNCFLVYYRYKRDPLKLEDLWNLRNLREIVGYIYIDLNGDDIPLQNLTFLENLYKVTTECEFCWFYFLYLRLFTLVYILLPPNNCQIVIIRISQQNTA